MQIIFYCAHTDFQGSLISLTDEAGNMVECYAYDPWGKRRNPEDWTQPDTRISLLTNRGYTMHEHLDWFGVINMNGRVYDPLTAMFFSPDPYLQSPDNWLNYNRYAYCLNNPFRYTDPSGERTIFIKAVRFIYHAVRVVVVTAVTLIVVAVPTVASYFIGGPVGTAIGFGGGLWLGSKTAGFLLDIIPVWE